MVKLPTLLEMLQAGVHFGHQRGRWHPKMQEYIFGVRNNVHIIDLEKTLVELTRTLEYVKNLASEGKIILFVATKRQARDLVKAAALACGMPFLVERWIGGMLTNFDEVKKRLRKYNTMMEEIRSGEIEKYPKREQIKMKKEVEKMERYLAGIRDLDKMPDALYIADMRTEKTALIEAEKKNVTVVSVCDTNVNPEDADYIIPANDDAVNSIRLMADLIATTVNEGKALAEKRDGAVREVKKIVPVAPEVKADTVAKVEVVEEPAKKVTKAVEKPKAVRTVKTPRVAKKEKEV
ncbi:MAG TPA: 30S ribosomal protein S2 [Patescibacteria group bacterium]|nr:30S ribosomal protein S2 [Patescibacteria group bacterium]